MIRNEQGIESKLEEDKFGELSDKELREQASEKLSKAGMDKGKPDLAAYRAQKLVEQEQDTYAGMSWLESTKHKLQELVSGGEKARFSKQLNKLESTLAVYENKLSTLHEILNKQHKQLSELGDRKDSARSASELYLEQYTRATHRLERTEQELEELVSGGSEHSSQAREKREQVRILRHHQRETYRETQHAMNSYRSLLKNEAALDHRYEMLSDKVGVFQQQSDNVQVRIQDFKLEQELRFSSDGTNLTDLYEQTAISVQEMERLSEGVSNSYNGPEVDKTFEISVNAAEENDPLIKKWIRTPSP